jgi:hypothetical protein
LNSAQRGKIAKAQPRRGRSTFSPKDSFLKKSGDKTPLELFIAGIQGWEAGLRRRMDSQPQRTAPANHVVRERGQDRLADFG